LPSIQVSDPTPLDGLTSLQQLTLDNKMFRELSSFDALPANRLEITDKMILRYDLRGTATLQHIAT
jgi:hypothetical protein